MSRRPSIGDLRQRVTIESVMDTFDDVGGFARSFTPLAQVWARIEATGARDQFVEQRAEQSTTHVVTIRWRDDVKSQMRFAFRGRKLLIRSVLDHDERRRFLACECEEIS
ncbi:phage head closure protein [Methylocystis sp. WRRC1]|uniref:phage head closure protein n=1 Tax=Methylocystis sp. WRRC1 TaxID=1732014 RepID=UPI001D1512CE|nr:phage head closure protein [Methylocystis sp. WRRC1]MCC3244683.1 phage head closure protein [Methylocystis sp. WRRC1]